MLSTRYRFLFVHVPKTGGNSVQDGLRPYSDDRLVCLAPHQDGVERFELRSDRFDTQKHSTLTEYQRQYGPTLFNALYRFACCRNPWDRLVSFYFSPHRGPVSWSREEFLSFIPTVHPLRHYLALPHDAAPTLEAAVMNVHCVLRFEALQADFNDICDTLGIARMALPRRNRSTRGDYRKYYDEESRELVAARFGDEVRLFNYDF